MARFAAPLVPAFATLVLLFFLFHSLRRRRQHLPHRRLKLRPAAIVLATGDHHSIPFDPIISEIEIIHSVRQRVRNHFASICGASPAEPQPERENFMDAEDYINDEDKFNVIDRIELLFPEIDVSPEDGSITHEELTDWNFKQAEEDEVLHQTR